MAYDFFPKSKKEIADKLQNKSQRYRDNCSRIFEYLQSKYPTIETQSILIQSWEKTHQSILFAQSKDH